MCFELMREMHWTWSDYEATPIFVRQFCWDFIMRRRRIQNSQADATQIAHERGSGVVRVKR